MHPVRQVLTVGALASLATAGLVVLAPGASPQTGASGSQTFTTVGEQTFTVPAGVTGITAEVFGAAGDGYGAGGEGADSGDAGGGGGGGGGLFGDGQVTISWVALVVEPRFTG